MSEKRMFEFVEGSSSKFWEIWRDGNEVRTRYGRIGSDGQTTLKSEADEAKAQKLYDKLVKEKTGKGYIEKTGGGGAPAAAPAAAAPAAAPAVAKKAVAKKAAKVEEDDDEGGDDDGDGGDEGGAGGGGFVRYEVDEKFWAIKLHGASHTVKFGKIGTNGAEKTKDFADAAAAKKDHDKLVKEKTGKGYELVSSGGDAGGGDDDGDDGDDGDDEAAAPKKKAAPAAAAKKLTGLLPWMSTGLGYRSADFDADDIYLVSCSINGDGDLAVSFGGTAGDGTFVCSAAAIESGAEKIHVAQGGATLSQSGNGVDGQAPTEAFPPFLLSRSLFTALKAGKPIAWPTVLTGDGKTVEVKKKGTGTKSITVNGKKQSVKTIEGEGDGGALSLIVLDDANWPLILTNHEADECGWFLKAVGKDLDADALAEMGDEDDEDEGEDEDEDGGDEDGSDGEGGGWRRFEMDEKFWAIQLDGASHTVKYGKQGTDGQEKTKTFDDEDAAKKDYDKLIKEKTGKGYEEVGADD